MKIFTYVKKCISHGIAVRLNKQKQIYNTNAEKEVIRLRQLFSGIIKKNMDGICNASYNHMAAIFQ